MFSDYSTRQYNKEAARKKAGKISPTSSFTIPILIIESYEKPIRMLGEVKLGHERKKPPSPEVSKKINVSVLNVLSRAGKAGRCEVNELNVQSKP